MTFFSVGFKDVNIRNNYLSQMIEASVVAGSGCGWGFRDKGAGSYTRQGQIAICLIDR